MMTPIFSLLPHRDDNLALQPGVQIFAPPLSINGCGAEDPATLLNERVHHLDGLPLADFEQRYTYDTYDGQNSAADADCYRIEFPEAIICNVIEMTMGLPYRDGGWWTSLQIAIDHGDGEWVPVEDLRMTPPYDFTDDRHGRRPYETYALTFRETSARRIAISGQGGGLAQFTSLARFAIYHRDLSRWNPTSLPDPPTPLIFKLIPPQMIWDLSKHLATLVGLNVTVPLMEFYLDDVRFEQFWQTVRWNYTGKPNLFFLLGQTIGWRNLRLGNTPLAIGTLPLHESLVFQDVRGLLAHAAAHIIVGDQVLGTMQTDPVILQDAFDLSAHRHVAEEYHIPWTTYQRAIGRSTLLSAEQLQAVAALMELIANTIANLAHRNTSLEAELASGALPTNGIAWQSHKDLVRQAITLMQEHVESSLGVTEIAAMIGVSAPYFSTLFKEQMGCSPRTYFSHLRLERAKDYLAHTSMSVIDVCGALGYDPSYFSRFFKRHVGCTPWQYGRPSR